MTTTTPTTTAPSTRGVIQVAMGGGFVHEAAVACRSARRHLPVPFTLFTDCPDIALAIGCWDEVVALPRSGHRAHRDKLVAMQRTPYDRTLLLDTDVYVAAGLDDCWALLDTHDLAASGDRGYVDDFPVGTDVPAGFKEINTGVLFFRRSAALDAVLADALVQFDRLRHGEAGGGPKAYDQPALRLALYDATLRVAPLQDEDNCRFANYGKLNGPVRVLHGRLPRARHTQENLERVLARLNATTVPRVFAGGHCWALAPRRLRLWGPYRAARLPRYLRAEPRPVVAAVLRDARRWAARRRQSWRSRRQRAHR